MSVRIERGEGQRQTQKIALPQTDHPINRQPITQTNTHKMALKGKSRNIQGSSTRSPAIFGPAPITRFNGRELGQ